MIHKIAILADVHGNETALKAVLVDCKKEIITDYWFLGDLIMPGPGASSLFSLIQSVKPTVFLKGNWEDCFLAGLGSEIDVDEPMDIYIATLAHYLKQNLTAADLTLIKDVPLATVQEINGLKISLTHNLPTKNYGPALMPNQKQENFEQLFAEEVDIAVYAHVHHQLMRYSNQDQLIINPGSIGQPFTHWPTLQKDLRAQYAILEIDEEGRPQVNFKRTPYDVPQEINLAQTKELPYFELYEELLQTGHRRTHEPGLLADLNQRYGYRDEIVSLLNSLNN